MTKVSAATHNDLIATAAKAHLPAIGMKRKGKSRLWTKDNAWWIAVVEFQPSAWTKGTYLNVAASWLWHSKDHLAFNEFQRVAGFAEFIDPQSFAAAANSYALQAATEVQALCDRFSSLSDVAAHLRAKADGNPWDHYHAMMASLATGDLALARMQHIALKGIDHDVPWCVALKAKATEIMREAQDNASALSIVSNEILSARARLKLPSISISQIW